MQMKLIPYLPCPQVLKTLVTESPVYRRHQQHHGLKEGQTTGHQEAYAGTDEEQSRHQTDWLATRKVSFMPKIIYQCIPISQNSWIWNGHGLIILFVVWTARETEWQLRNSKVREGRSERWNYNLYWSWQEKWNIYWEMLLRELTNCDLLMIIIFQMFLICYCMIGMFWVVHLTKISDTIVADSSCV